MSQLKGEKIGTVTLTKEHVFTRHFEFAAWYINIKVQPGTFDLMGEFENGRLKHWWARLNGVNVGSNMSAYFGGVMAVPDYDSNLGREEEYTVSGWYAGSFLAELILEGKPDHQGLEYQLVDSLKARRRDFSYQSFTAPNETVSGQIEEIIRV
jgi:hypothetical protein